MKASIIINNYNYASFLKKAIDSALSQSYENCEVIVVDDGSQDNSSEIMSDYGDKILAICKENGGQMSCYERGFDASSGDVVLFLDSDDYLHPCCMEECINAWLPGTSKVQFYLDIVDENGISTGGKVPSGRMESSNALGMMCIYSSYCSPPGSGNAFCASFLRKILPVSNSSELKHSADSVPIYAAPFYGLVISINKTLGYYRRHSKSNSSVQLSFNLAEARKSLEREHERDLLRDRSWRLVAPTNVIKTDLFLHDPSRAKRGVCYYRLNNRSSFADESQEDVLAKLSSCIKSTIYWNGYSPFQKFVACFWFALVLFLPFRLALILIRLALAHGERGAFVHWFLGKNHTGVVG